MNEQPKEDMRGRLSTVRIYRDGKPEDIPVKEFLAMLEKLKHG
jgi:hypothetical protein